jgi:hypothetical protein
MKLGATNGKCIWFSDTFLMCTSLLCNQVYKAGPSGHAV